jgi:hypothetical protein
MKKTIELKIPYNDINDFKVALKESKIKHWPFRRGYPGYLVTVVDAPTASFLILKYTN